MCQTVIDQMLHRNLHIISQFTFLIMKLTFDQTSIEATTT